MAGLEALASIIYHEKQQSGSMLCAQHALNSLLQGNYFSAPDLSDIARGLDALEESYRDQETGSREASTNMDDTGFFSVQVLENALSVWGLNLVRWRSAQMRPYQDRPHTQLAFILNYQQHWFTLRRFGPAQAKPDLDPGEGHWFNLNSFLAAPEWVGKLYLGMLLQQAEADGYSVFAVIQADPSKPLALPRTEADQIAATLPEPSETPNYHSSRSYTTEPTPASSTQTPSTGGMLSESLEGFEDEDFELQAALQASLMKSSSSTNDPPIEPPPLTRATVPLPASGPSSAPGSGSITPHQVPHLPAHQPVWGTAVHPPHPTGDADLDPVSASMERNRVRLQRMREQQEFAQRELWAERGFGPEGPSRTDDDDEDEMLRRAIAESEAMARTEGHGRSDEAADVNADSGSTARDQYPVGRDVRVYDDEDAELQAALKASLEHAPPDWIPPELTPTPPRHPTTEQAPQPIGLTSQATSAQTDSTIDTTDTEDTESIMSEASSSQPAAALAPLDAEELRRKRLARFGT